MSFAIEIRNLTKTYPKGRNGLVHAVTDLTLSVPNGQVVGLLGTNGAGKTTTIKMMCGLVEPTTGQIVLNGFNVASQRSRAMQQIGVVLEGTRNIYWRLSAWQNLLYFGRLKGCWKRSMKHRAEQLLRDLDLWDRRSDPVKQLSRGMQQKVAIACALIANPPIVLLDEPTLGLDVHATRTIKEWTQHLARECGKTIVLTTHQLDSAEELCDRIVIIREGEVIADRPMTALLDLFRQDHYEIYVEGEIGKEAFSLSGALIESLSIVQENGQSILRGAIENQVVLYELLEVIRAHGLPLISVQRAVPKLEDVFVQLTDSRHGDR